MDNLNIVPKQGTFGGAMDIANQNFSLIVAAINGLEYRTTRSKGVLSNGVNPASAFPNAKQGDWCVVLGSGNTFPATIKTFNGSTWTGDGQWSPGNLDLTEYAKTADMNAAIAAAVAAVEIETADNLTTQTPGKALDAHQGFVLAGQIEDAQAGIASIKGGEVVLSPVAVISKYIYNGNVAGTNVGYWASYSTYKSYIFDVSAYNGKSIMIYGTFYTNGYKRIFCLDYNTLPATKSAYDEDTTRWTDNMISATTARGSTSGGDYNATIEIPQGAVYLILVGNSSKIPAATVVIGGEMASIRQELTRLDEFEDDVEQAKTELAEIGVMMTGNLLPIKTISGYAIDNQSGSSAIGNWRSSSKTEAYIFDVSALRGKTITRHSWCCANRFLYAYVRDYKGISPLSVTDGETAIAWADNVVAKNSSRSPNTSGAAVNASNETVPAEATHLIILGYNGQVPTVTTNGLEDRIEALESGAGVGTEILKLNSDKDFMPLVKNMAKAYNDNTPPLVLAHFSDVHGNGTQIGRMLEWCGHYSSYIDDILHTGDSVKNTFNDGMSFWTGVSGSENILNITGNHDTHDGNSFGGKTAAEVYGLLMEPYIANWGVTEAGSGLCYWYKDYTSKKVRLIGLDCMNRNAAQLSWLQDVLDGALEAGLAVVIASHSGPSQSYETVRCNFCNPFPPSSVGAYPWTAAVNAVEDFKTGGGNFICWLGGHCHKDFVTWIGGSQLCILVDCAYYNTADRDHTLSREDKSQDCFNLVAFDIVRKMVKLLRVGNNIDLHMRHIGTCCIKYTTGEVLQMW